MERPQDVSAKPPPPGQPLQRAPAEQVQPPPAGRARTRWFTSTPVPIRSAPRPPRVRPASSGQLAEQKPWRRRGRRCCTWRGRARACTRRASTSAPPARTPCATGSPDGSGRAGAARSWASPTRSGCAGSALHRPRLPRPSNYGVCFAQIALLGSNGGHGAQQLRETDILLHDDAWFSQVQSRWLAWFRHRLADAAPPAAPGQIAWSARHPVRRTGPDAALRHGLPCWDAPHRGLLQLVLARRACPCLAAGSLSAS